MSTPGTVYINAPALATQLVLQDALNLLSEEQRVQLLEQIASHILTRESQGGLATSTPFKEVFLDRLKELQVLVAEAD